MPLTNPQSSFSSNNPGDPAIAVAAAPGQGPGLGHPFVVAFLDSAVGIRPDGSHALPTLADAAAQNNSLYFSSTSNKLCFKDSTGAVHVTST